MPTPKENETKDEYLKRCMGDTETSKYQPDQRYAICNSMWEEHFISKNGEVTKEIKPSEK